MVKGEFGSSLLRLESLHFVSKMICNMSICNWDTVVQLGCSDQTSYPGCNTACEAGRRPDLSLVKLDFSKSKDPRRSDREKVLWHPLPKMAERVYTCRAGFV
jgi:hypothetical protein